MLCLIFFPTASKDSTLYLAITYSMPGIFFLSASQILICVIFITTSGGSVTDTAPLMNPQSYPIAPEVIVDSSMWSGSEDQPLVVNIWFQDPTLYLSDSQE